MKNDNTMLDDIMDGYGIMNMNILARGYGKQEEILLRFRNDLRIIDEMLEKNLLESKALNGFEFDMSGFNEIVGQVKYPTIDTQISNLKSQLRYCKNPLQKLNTERKIGRLNRERSKRK